MAGDAYLFRPLLDLGPEGDGIIRMPPSGEPNGASNTGSLIRVGFRSIRTGSESLGTLSTLGTPQSTTKVRTLSAAARDSIDRPENRGVVISKGWKVYPEGFIDPSYYKITN